MFGMSFEFILWTGYYQVAVQMLFYNLNEDMTVTSAVYSLNLLLIIKFYNINITKFYSQTFSS